MYKNNVKLISVLFLSLITFTSCSTTQEPGKTVLAPTPVAIALKSVSKLRYLKIKNLADTVPVFIVSSRNLLDNPSGIHRFGNKRSQLLLPYLAVADVSIGANQTKEVVLDETFNTVKRKRSKVKVEHIEVYEAPKADLSSTFADKLSQFNKTRWVKKLKSEMDRSKTKEIIIFVHGYNTHLVSNTELMAEIYHYAGRDGVVINFEWPSAGRLLGYFQDKGNAEYSTRLFRNFIRSLASISGAQKIRIIAHSAGNPIVVSALKDLRLIEGKLSAAQLRQKYKIEQVILAAPDMDSMRFINAVFDKFYEMSRHVTVYASPEDKALKLSSRIFGVSRLGESIGKFKGWEKTALHKAKNIHLVDVSVAEKWYRSGLGHGYFHNNPWVSSDILLSSKTPNPSKRGLVKAKGEIFWKFSSDYPQRLIRRSR